MTWWDGQKLRVLSLFLEGKKPKEMALDVTAAEETIRKWTKHEKFLKAVDFHREETLSQIRTREITLLDSALDRVAQIMKNGDRHQGIQLAAAKIILDRAAPVEKGVANKEEQGGGMKVIVINPLQLTEAQKQDVRDFEAELGYDKVIPPVLRRGDELRAIEAARLVNPEE